MLPKTYIHFSHRYSQREHTHKMNLHIKMLHGKHFENICDTTSSFLYFLHILKTTNIQHLIPYSKNCIRKYVKITASKPLGKLKHLLGCSENYRDKCVKVIKYQKLIIITNYAEQTLSNIFIFLLPSLFTKSYVIKARSLTSRYQTYVQFLNQSFSQH